MATFRNGQGGSVIFDSVTLQIETWSAKLECDVLDTTNTGDGAWQSNIAGINKATGSIKTYLDFNAIPFATFYQGYYATLKLNLGSTGKFLTGGARISNVSIENPVKGVITMSFDFESNGVWTWPT